MLEKEEALGLTHSWNVGYRFDFSLLSSLFACLQLSSLLFCLVVLNLFRIGKILKYKYLIFANNDILVPQGAVDMCRRGLLTEALVVPMTTKKGAGHNPS